MNQKTSKNQADLKTAITKMKNTLKRINSTLPDELWTEVHDIVQQAVIKTIPKKKKCKKQKWLSKEALQIAVKRIEAKNTGEKERYTHMNADF